MSSYRERLQENWFYHYQRADTARVRDKGVKKKVYIYSFYIPSSVPLSLNLPPSLCLSVSFSLSLALFLS